jgi:NAD(P)H-dependent flavin oxidoreductase YrpB (nitropropane dioxygenase family)
MINSQCRPKTALLGADLVTLMGFDSGGLPGEVDVGIFVQMALAKKLLRIPFICSGGVATGRQIVAALALGAIGVQIGTRFNATTDCTMFPPTFKERMVNAGVKDTALVMRPMVCCASSYICSPSSPAGS